MKDERFIELFFVIPVELKKRLKVQAARQEITMKDFVIQAIDEKLIHEESKN